jgi:hypothetical protein
MFPPEPSSTLMFSRTVRTTILAEAAALRLLWTRPSSGSAAPAAPGAKQAAAQARLAEAMNPRRESLCDDCMAISFSGSLLSEFLFHVSPPVGAKGE